MLCVLCSVFSLRVALAGASDLRPSKPSLGSSPALAQAHQGHTLFENVQLRSKTDIHFDPATRMVTIKMRIMDPHGYFVPNLRPDDFLVYEDGVREDDRTVEVERLPVRLGILLEYGGRFSAMNAALGQDISMAAMQLQGEIWRDDEVALWRYGDRIEELAGFSAAHEKLFGALGALGTPALSEIDLYDALIDALARLKAMSGTKALLLVSSGVDTFSNHEFEDVRWAIRAADLPIYVINLDTVLEQDVLLNSEFARYDHINWKRATGDLREIAELSGGRMYIPQTAYGLSAIYDNLMERLRVRYVIKYRPTIDSTDGIPRTVRIEVGDSRSGGPLQVVMASGRTVRAHRSRRALHPELYVGFRLKPHPGQLSAQESRKLVLQPGDDEVNAD